jgi:gliding motility-associated-like protein
MPLAVGFNDQSQGNITTWNWTFGNGSTSISTNPTQTYTAPGSYDVTLIVGTPGNCYDTIIQPNYILVEACQDLTITDPLANDTTGCQYLITGTTNIPVQSVTLTGDILDGPVTATLLDSTHWQVLVTMNVNQSNMATLYATGDFGNNLFDMDTVTVVVDCPFAIPNVFSPDGDGINDFFVVVVGATTKYHMEVYNRWGRRVFLSTDQNLLWDGKSPGGENCSEGVYYYIFTGEQGGNDLEKKGTVTLLR